MADYNSSLPVRSEVNNSTSDIQISIADGVTNTNLWQIDGNSIGQVNLNDGNNSVVIGNNGELTAIISDGTDTLQIDGSGNLSTIITDGTDTLLIDGQGNLGSVIWNAAGTNSWAIDTNGLGPVIISDGTETLAINTDGSINVNVVTTSAGDQIHVYDTVASIAADDIPVDVVDYTVTAAKTLLLQYVHAAASGKAKVLVLTGPSGSETVKAVFFISTASGFGYAEFPNKIEVVAGDKVLVQIANLDNQTQDGYAYINGVEV